MKSTGTGVDFELLVHEAVASVDDPEYPGVSIVDLGLLETLLIDDAGGVRIGLVPTFSGCPALAMIADDVRDAVAALEWVTAIEIEWLAAPAWSTDRVSEDARSVLSKEFTVAVQIGSSAKCPLCGEPTVEKSLFGPSRCRSVHRCEPCSETIEVLRG
ncbi:MAG: iron-sulfur cluster assembly protein [Acidimicrobiales bacterium]